MVGTLGYDPSQEQSSTAKGFIRPSRVPTPAPIRLYYIIFIDDAISNLEGSFSFLLRLSQQYGLPNI